MEVSASGRACIRPSSLHSQRPYLLRGCPRSPVVARASCATATRPTSTDDNNSGQRTTDVRICTNKTCKRQGSQQILQLAQDLGLPGVKVEASGCLGTCGAGPNIVLLPSGQLLSHVGTPADLADALRTFGHLPVSQDTVTATQLRLAGNDSAYGQDFEKALSYYKQALELTPALGAYRLHSNMSSAHAQLGDKQAALASAQLAVDTAPPGFATAWVRLVDSHYALKQYREAADACRRAFASNPSYKKLPDFKLIGKALQAVGHRVL